MSASTPTVDKNVAPGNGSVILVTWALLSADVTGLGFEWPQWADRCIQAVGANWGGATLTIEGSNNGTTWSTLTNAAGGTAATFTADGIKQILEVPRFVRPKLTTAGTLADVAVLLLARRSSLK